MFDKRRLAVRRAAVMLVAMQLSLAFFGNAQAHDVDEYVEVYADLTVARAADISRQIRAGIEATIANLNADAKARLDAHIRLSTRELLVAAAPADDDVAVKPTQSVRNDSLTIPGRQKARIARSKLPPTTRSAYDEENRR